MIRMTWCMAGLLTSLVLASSTGADTYEPEPYLDDHHVHESDLGRIPTSAITIRWTRRARGIEEAHYFVDAYRVTRLVSHRLTAAEVEARRDAGAAVQPEELRWDREGDEWCFRGRAGDGVVVLCADDGGSFSFQATRRRAIRLAAWLAEKLSISRERGVRYTSVAADVPLVAALDTVSFLDQLKRPAQAPISSIRFVRDGRVRVAFSSIQVLPDDASRRAYAPDRYEIVFTPVVGGALFRLVFPFDSDRSRAEYIPAGRLAPGTYLVHVAVRNGYGVRAEVDLARTLVLTVPRSLDPLPRAVTPSREFVPPGPVSSSLEAVDPLFDRGRGISIRAAICTDSDDMVGFRRNDEVPYLLVTAPSTWTASHIDKPGIQLLRNDPSNWGTFRGDPRWIKHSSNLFSAVRSPGDRATEWIRFAKEVAPRTYVYSAWFGMELRNEDGRIVIDRVRVSSDGPDESPR